MTTSQHKIHIGLFAAITGALIGVVIVVWGGLHLFTHRTRYAIEVEASVNGLVKGADVLYQGIQVGAVHSIELAPDDIRRVRIEIDVDSDTPIRADTKATLSLAGITGSKVIDLQAGEPTAPPLPPGGTLAVGETTIDKLEHQLDDIASHSRHLLDRVDHITASAETLLANLAEISDPHKVDRVIARSTAALDELAAASAEARAMVQENRAPIASAVSDLRQASRSFKELAREVREQPSRLLSSAPRPDRRLPR